jgi:hypothetical protein
MFGPILNPTRGFWGFPAGSLPRLRSLQGVVPKYMIASDFLARGEFYPEFSRAAGKDRGGPTRPAFRPLALLRWGEDQGLCPVMQALPAAVALAETCR